MALSSSKRRDATTIAIPAVGFSGGSQCLTHLILMLKTGYLYLVKISVDRVLSYAGWCCDVEYSGVGHSSCIDFAWTSNLGAQRCPVPELPSALHVLVVGRTSGPDSTSTLTKQPISGVDQDNPKKLFSRSHILP